MLSTKRDSCFALIDCNNFYASCERIFRPDLEKKPLIVLSNNDGCVIARSNEARALGIGMAEPYFKIRDLCRRQGVQVFSSNFSLYGDISERIMSMILATGLPVEIYSIDEAFIDLSSLKTANILNFAAALQADIQRCIGVPTSIGIGQTKTLAKLANYVAKRRLGVPVFMLQKNSTWLAKLPVAEVWGIGVRSAEKLATLGIHKVADLAACNPRWLRQQSNLMLQRTAYELAGISCIELDSISPKQSILSSRSFDKLQTELQALKQAISYHMAICFEKLRRQQSVAGYISVFIYSNRHRPDLEQYRPSLSLHLLEATDDLRKLTRYALEALDSIYKSGIAYKKAGVMLGELRALGQEQQSLLRDKLPAKQQDCEPLMRTIEQINQRFGRGSLRLAAQGFEEHWAMRRELRSPRYTTQWGELLQV